MDAKRGGSRLEPASLEELENIRRMADRGIINTRFTDSRLADMFQHIADLVEVIKSYEKT